MLKSRRGHEAIYFEDISSPDYSPRRNSGISYADAMDTIHVIKKDGSVVLVRTSDMFFTGPRPWHEGQRQVMRTGEKRAGVKCSCVRKQSGLQVADG